MNKPKANSVLIIGAGISGLTVGHSLSQKGFSVTLLEKSSGVGGRIATRRWESGHWNHGLPWLERKDVPDSLWKLWSQALIEVPSLKGPRFVSSEGLTQLAKLLAKDLTVHKKSRAVKVEFLNETNSWKVTDDATKEFFADILILTCPTPQTVDLLKETDLLKLTGLEENLSSVRYRPQFIGLAACEPGSTGFLARKAEPPFEMLIENSGFITLYMDESFSSSRWNQTDKEISEEILDLSKKAKLGIFKHFELKRWRYSQCINSSHLEFMKADPPYPLYVIGDAFCGGGLSGAIYSALKLSESLPFK